jgi:hypothetical protein
MPTAVRKKASSPTADSLRDNHRTVISTTVDSDLAKNLRALARRRGWTLAQLLRFYIRGQYEAERRLVG